MATRKAQTGRSGGKVDAPGKKHRGAPARHAGHQAFGPDDSESDRGVERTQGPSRRIAARSPLVHARRLDWVPALILNLPVAILYVEELKATMRGRFAWLGAPCPALRSAGSRRSRRRTPGSTATASSPTASCRSRSFRFAAGAIASPRANRFVESVFTAPVERRDWLVAKVLVLLTLAARLLPRARADAAGVRRSTSACRFCCGSS